MSTTKKFLIALAIIGVLWAINDPAGAAGFVDTTFAAGTDVVKSAAAFLSNVFN